MTTGLDKLNLLEVSKLKNVQGGGEYYQVVNLLAQQHANLKYGQWIPTNMTMTNVASIIVGEPNVYTRRFNQGTPASRPTFDTVVDDTALIEAFAVTDATMLRVTGSADQTRSRVNRTYQSAMAKKLGELQFYGNTADDETEFNGLFTRPSLAAAGDYTIDCEGAGPDIGSILVLRFTEDGLFWTYPRNTQAGLIHEDLGVQLLQESTDTAGRMIRCFVDQWQWFCGLAMPDLRCAGRLANIDVSEMKAAFGAQEVTDYGTNVIYQLDEMIDRVNVGPGQIVLMMPRAIRSGINRLAKIMAMGNVSVAKDVFSKPVLHWQGMYPMEICDQMVITETAF